MPKNKGARRLSFGARRSREGVFFIIPWVVGFLVFWGFPLVTSLLSSFRQVSQDTILWGNDWIGMGNYLDVVGDVDFGTYFLKTLSGAALDIPILVIFALFIAVLLNRELAGRAFFRSVFFLPVILSASIMKSMDGTAALSMDFSSLFTGSLSALTELLNEDVIGRLGDILWQSSVQILIFLAGLQTISPALYEAASIDGASPWESFWKITLPQITPLILLNIVYSIIDSFTGSSNRIALMINNAKMTNKYGFAAAIGWMYCVVVLVVILAVFLVFVFVGSDKRRRRRA